MTNYIPAEKLKEIINYHIECFEKELKSFSEEDYVCSVASRFAAMKATMNEVQNIIDSLQQEQTEDIVVIAKTFLDALSKIPYNNKLITDAQIIVKQLLLFLENHSKYNPDAIVEQPEVDLEKELISYYNEHFSPCENGVLISEESGRELDCNDYESIARHFYELGLLNTRKEE